MLSIKYRIADMVFVSVTLLLLFLFALFLFSPFLLPALALFLLPALALFLFAPLTFLLSLVIARTRFAIAFVRTIIVMAIIAAVEHYLFIVLSKERDTEYTWCPALCVAERAISLCADLGRCR